MGSLKIREKRSILKKKQKREWMEVGGEEEERDFGKEADSSSVVGGR